MNAKQQRKTCGQNAVERLPAQRRRMKKPMPEALPAQSKSLSLARSCAERPPKLVESMRSTNETSARKLAKGSPKKPKLLEKEDGRERDSFFHTPSGQNAKVCKDGGAQERCNHCARLVVCVPFLFHLPRLIARSELACPSKCSVGQLQLQPERMKNSQRLRVTRVRPASCHFASRSLLQC